MLNETELKSWLQTLSPYSRQQVEIVKDLLDHAASDRMSTEDRINCVQALRLLEEDHDKSAAS